MKFCTQCGKTLSILNHHSGDICQKCTPQTPAKIADASDVTDISRELYSATFALKDGKIVLLSEEGWLLWSGDTVHTHTLQTILDRADRILKIRKRQKK